MRLSEFIQLRRKDIINEWVTFASAMHPWSSGLSQADLRDHAEELLTAVIRDMKLPQGSSARARKSKGGAPDGPLGKVGQQHATERWESGLDLNQLVSEYRALRASVLRLWEAESDKQGEITRFNEAIDETLTASAARYSETVATTRDQFVAILGHDLRNPLGAITVGAAQLTKSGHIGDMEVRVASRILNSAGRMTRMIADLLDLTRTRLGSGIPIIRSLTDLTSVCAEVIAELEMIYPDREVRFETKGDLHGDWDSDRLTQVVSNLVANALQYGGDLPVTVSARAEGDEVVLRVKNEGSVISSAAIKRIFEPMVRDQPTTQIDVHNRGGLGLGLFIVQQVVTAHCGRIDVSSTADAGTTFTVYLPRKAPPKRSETPAVVRRVPAKKRK